MFGKKGKYDYLIVGLGNYTPKYFKTRHNVGFMVADSIIEEYSAVRKNSKFKASVYEAEISGKICMVMKPETFMNNSGDAVQAAASYFKIPPQNILVVYDDISLDVGRLRIRRKGSAGGHNGIKSIIEQLGSEDFPRIKIGVGNKPHPDYDLAKWVLSEFKPNEQENLRHGIINACDCIRIIVGGDTDKAMNLYNNK